MKHAYQDEFCGKQDAKTSHNEVKSVSRTAPDFTES